MLYLFQYNSDFINMEQYQVTTGSDGQASATQVTVMQPQQGQPQVGPA